MADWVRDKDALFTILQLRALKVGDEVIEQRQTDMHEARWVLNSQSAVNTVQGFYGENLSGPPDFSEKWRLVAWRRNG